ncbi:TetR/AcrR family transcriptional regulator [Rhodococcus sp. SMB37]|uniref:TetR/AcrR family transcriptional regulator n=1 Tax=Rhodococcus sp. SMB37 TaxID=2512213 RepID=UPI00104B4D33|nr:TetR/AcrR family transcriptional regulator [Rhodococcus sp. SMB37]
MASRRGRYSSGQETRLLLVETAERLFAMRGYHPVTLADVRAAAGQNNASVVRYYFGSKEGLLTAILDHRLPRISAYRGELIREWVAVGATFTARDALWCLVEPLADSVRRGEYYVALLDRLLEAEIIGKTFIAADPGGTASGFEIDRVLHGVIADIPEDTRKQRVIMVYTSVLGTLAQYARTGAELAPTELPALVDAWEGLLCAPTSEETRETRALAGR